MSARKVRADPGRGRAGDVTDQGPTEMNRTSRSRLHGGVSCRQQRHRRLRDRLPPPPASIATASTTTRRTAAGGRCPACGSPRGVPPESPTHRRAEVKIVPTWHLLVRAAPDVRGAARRVDFLLHPISYRTHSGARSRQPAVAGLPRPAGRDRGAGHDLRICALAFLLAGGSVRGAGR